MPPFLRSLAPAILTAALLSAPGRLAAQTMDHSRMMAQMSGAMPTEPGQGAFAAIAEIVSILQSDPATDWSRVNIEALRQHLIDMDNVTLRAQVTEEDVTGGAIFTVTSPDAAVVGSIRRMTAEHVATMSGSEGLTMQADPVADGSRVTVTGPDARKIRALSFIGILTLGMHHQPHHLAIAKGDMMH